MTVNDLTKLQISELWAKAAELLAEILDPIPFANQKPEWGEMLEALRQRSKEAIAGSSIFAPKDGFNPARDSLR